MGVRQSAKLGRRAFLGSVGASAALLPFLPITESEANDGAFPKRLVVFCMPNANAFAPITAGRNGDANLADVDLPPILAPLRGGIKARGIDIDDLTPHTLVLQNLDLDAAFEGPQPGPHLTGISSLLTGNKLQPPSNSASFVGSGEPAGWCDGISIDQLVANEIGADTPHRSLNLGVQVFGGTKSLRHVMSYRGPGNPVPVRSDPYKVFDDVFGDVTQTPEELERVRVRRQSVIDFVRADLDAVRTKVSTEDALKVDAHLDSVRSIEQRLSADLKGCAPPEMGQELDPKNGSNDSAVSKLQMDLLVEALACGVTRVGSVLWGTALNQCKFGFLDGVDGDATLHSLTHRTETNDVTNQCQKISHWYMKQLAYFCQRLKNTPEGDGTMLDNTLVVWCSETGNAKNHRRRNLSFLLIGNAGGYFDTGRWLSYGGQPHNKLLTSISHAFGIEQDFGLTNVSTGILGKLRA